MKQKRLVNLPVIGMIQHGRVEKTPKGTKKVIELNHFVAKVTEEHMEEFLMKYNELYEGKSSIDIEIFDENPLTTKYVRYNQSGAVCSCLTTSNIAHQKTKDGWKEVNCSSECEHRQRNEQGKCNCNRIGWFKFLMPSICKDRIWLMKITGQRSISRLQDYFKLQQVRGESLKGHYTLFLKQEEVSDFTGKTYNHYILDIVKKSDNTFFNVSSINELNSELSTEKDKAVDNNTQNVDISENQNKENKTKTNTTKKTEKTSIETTNKCEKTTSKKTDVANKNIEEKTKVQQEDTTDNCYVLMRTYKQDIIQKNGENKSYVMGEFYDMEDKQFNVAIKPEDAKELQKCDMGTVTKLELKNFNDVYFAIKLDYVQKLEKNIAA